MLKFFNTFTHLHQKPSKGRTRIQKSVRKASGRESLYIQQRLFTSHGLLCTKKNNRNEWNPIPVWFGLISCIFGVFDMNQLVQWLLMKLHSKKTMYRVTMKRLSVLPILTQGRSFYSCLCFVIQIQRKATPYDTNTHTKLPSRMLTRHEINYYHFHSFDIRSCTHHSTAFIHTHTVIIYTLVVCPTECNQLLQNVSEKPLRS